MKTTGLSLIVAASAALMCMAGTAFAQDTQFVVHYKLLVDQPSLFDKDAHDTFKGTIDDALGITSLKTECNAGSSGFIGLGRTDEACSLEGNGMIRNPNKPEQTALRVNYSGGYTIKAKEDGYTDASTLKADYQRLGGAAAESSTFGGSVTMMPENPSKGALELAGRLFDKIKEKSTGVQAVDFNTKIDSVQFEDFTIPHVGQKGSVACSWSGPNIYAYANEAWQMSFDVKCGDTAPIKLEGNMALVDAEAGSDHDQEYRLNLVVPGAGGGDPFAEADPFAVVTGVTATLNMKNSGRNLDGVFEKVEVSGDFIGIGVPAELVRGVAEMTLVFSRTWYGA